MIQYQGMGLVTKSDFLPEVAKPEVVKKIDRPLRALVSKGCSSGKKKKFMGSFASKTDYDLGYSDPVPTPPSYTDVLHSSNSVFTPKNSSTPLSAASITSSLLR